MDMHFPTVPVEAVRRMASQSSDWLRPLVLVVDDEPLITETLAVILNGNGLAAMTAPNAAEALEIAALTPPELLIADLAMPGMNGLDMAEEVTRMAPDCRVILFSGHVTAGEMLKQMLSRGYDFAWLMKPVHPADLLDRAFEILGKRGSPLGLPRPSRNPNLYDFLSTAGRGGDVNSGSWNFTMRQRSKHAGESQ